MELAEKMYVSNETTKSSYIYVSVEQHEELVLFFFYVSKLLDGCHKVTRAGSIWLQRESESVITTI